MSLDDETAQRLCVTFVDTLGYVSTKEPDSMLYAMISVYYVQYISSSRQQGRIGGQKKLAPPA